MENWEKDNEENLNQNQAENQETTVNQTGAADGVQGEGFTMNSGYQQNQGYRDPYQSSANQYRPDQRNYTSDNAYGEAYTTGSSQDGGTTYYYSGEPQKRRKRERRPSPPVTRRFFIVCLIICCICSAVLGAGGYMFMMSNFGGTTIDKSVNTTNYNLTSATGAELSIQEIIAKNANSVVAVTTEYVVTDTWMGQYVTKGAGSGVVYSEDGYIVTNNHVIADATKINVTMNDGSEYPATLVATDATEDIAVIKVEATGLKPITFGEMNKVSVGDLTVAIGNPLGTLSGTATTGIVSALERQITVSNVKMTLIQTDTAVNPGNSGGGLFDQYGNLIGLVVAKSGGSDVEGLGFAIPCDRVKDVTGDLITEGHVTGRPAIGVNIIDLTSPEKAMQYGVSITGVYISEVTGENATAAGLKKGDLIYYIDDTKVTGSDLLVSVVRSHNIGDSVTLTIVRDNEMMKVDVTLEDSATVGKVADDAVKEES